MTNGQIGEIDPPGLQPLRARPDGLIPQEGLGLEVDDEGDRRHGQRAQGEDGVSQRDGLDGRVPAEPVNRPVLDVDVRPVAEVRPERSIVPFSGKCHDCYSGDYRERLSNFELV